MLGISLLVCILSATLGSADIYTTNPIASTVWTAGQSANITWTDDNRSPLLKDMGPVSIELYTNTTHVSTLATGVDPDSRFRVIDVSSSWVQTGADYHLRFMCMKPSLIVYSADFTIVPSNNGTVNKALSSNTSASSSTSLLATTQEGPRILPLLTISLPDTTVTLAPTPSGMLSSGTSVNNAVKTSTSTSTSSSYSTTDETKATSTQRESSTNGAGRRLRDNYANFRLLSVIWPIIIGVTMAF